MSKISLSGSIGSLVDFYKHERNIFGRCPHCAEPFRLSEVKLTYGKEPPRDLITRMKKERDKLEEQLDALNSEIDQLEDDRVHELELLNQKWISNVDNAVEKQLRKTEKAIRQKAIAQSRAGQLGKTLEKVVPMFPGFGHHPYDVRPIFDPIDFVIFDGYYQGSVTDVVFVEFKTGHSRLSATQGSIRKAIESKRVHFEEKRLSSDAIRMLTEGSAPQVKQMLKQVFD